MAPILSFTAEEVWETLTGKQDVSVFEQQWYASDDLRTLGEISLGRYDPARVEQWRLIRLWRTRVNKRLEEVRADGKIGSALQAEVDIYVMEEGYESLARLGDDLRLVMITSRANVHSVTTEAEQDIVVIPSTHTKCDRCWHYRADVGGDPIHPTLCGRCVSNLYGSGEARKYA
jgi:isoleucyl-tRNA synthetase